MSKSVFVEIAQRMRSGMTEAGYGPDVSDPVPAWASSVPAPTRSILIVEDDAAIRRLLVSVLASIGYRIESVADGSLALRILEDDASIDLVLTDICMPGISGTDVAEWLAQRRPNIKIVCMSGFAEPFEGSLKRLLEKRHVNFLAKPFNPSQVIQLVMRLLEGK